MLFGAATVEHVLKGPHPIAVLANLAMLMALIWYRDDFHAKQRPGLAADVAAVRAAVPGQRARFGVVSLLRRRTT